MLEKHQLLHVITHSSVTQPSSYPKSLNSKQQQIPGGNNKNHAKVTKVFGQPQF